MQRWFQASEKTCIVSGSLHPDVRLPMVDLNHQATCRHAANRLLLHGHRKLAFFRVERPSAGDMESERGFFEGIASVDGASGMILEHNGSPEGIRKMVAILLRKKPMPTGVLVLRANAALSLCSELIKVGLRIPEDISIVCRDSDHFLDYFSPEIARYESNPIVHAQGLAKLVVRLSKQACNPPPKLRFIPKFRSGQSLGMSR
jgi:LacI family transcriptional regulator